MNAYGRHVLVAIFLCVLLAACTQTQPAPDAVPRGDSAAPALQGRSGESEAVEEAELTQDRLEAFVQARARGEAGLNVRVEPRPAPGWNGAQLLNDRTDDWEPAVAADPNAPYVYMLTTRYGAPSTCAKHCPVPFIPLTISTDGGRSWGPQEPLCVCRRSSSQHDPIIEVVPKTGVVYAGLLSFGRGRNWSTVFTKSEDHGKTWTKPVEVYGDARWTDKPAMTMGVGGKHVYISWNGPKAGDLYVSVSHDFGETWSQTKLSDSKRYFYAYDGTVLPDGTVVFSESSLRYTGPGGSVEGRIWHHAVVSRDRGDTWRNVVIDKVAKGVPCVADGCYDDYYVGQTSVATDPAGDLVFAYEGAERTGGLQRVYTRTSADQGRTWSGRTAVSRLGENATGPMIDFAARGEARMWYMQTSRGGNPNAWNARFRSSSDGGTTWAPSVRLSDVESGPGYVGPHGFKEVYGDYGEIAVTNRGKAIAVWGEGFSYIGPGGTWFAVQK